MCPCYAGAGDSQLASHYGAVWADGAPSHPASPSMSRAQIVGPAGARPGGVGPRTCTARAAGLSRTSCPHAGRHGPRFSRGGGLSASRSGDQDPAYLRPCWVPHARPRSPTPRRYGGSGNRSNPPLPLGRPAFEARTMPGSVCGWTSPPPPPATPPRLSFGLPGRPRSHRRPGALG